MTNFEKCRLNFGTTILLVLGGLPAAVGPLAFCVLSAALTARAQPAVTPGLKFEVAAVKSHSALAPVPMGNGKAIFAGTTMSFSGPRATIKNASLTGLVEFAYDLKVDRASGAPRWADSERFDIAAKAEGGRSYTKDEFRQMFQALLAERFRLKFHLNKENTRGYSLVLAKDGPRLTKSAADAESSMRLGGTSGYAEMTVSKWTMAQLAFQLSMMEGHVEGGSLVPVPVLDATGIEGSYDFKLKWSDDRSPNPDPSLPSLFTAVQEQLGLKLEPRTALAKVLVIDNADRPSPN